ncbi:hypothetical protein J3R82DRAFT_6204 [Butyriboletus roseoflavus]|nr:hypothetical protein J3R82DRAFT_6204 [Butyriboletus roseoflavus]
MFRRVSGARDRSEPTLPSKSPLSSPTAGRAHAFYQHPSGSRFTEDAVSAVLSSDTGSDATSLGVPSAHSIPTWRGPARLQKLRRAPQFPYRPLAAAHVDEIVVNSESETTSGTSSTWTMASIPTPAPSPPLVALHPISFYPTPHLAESFTEYDRLQVRSDEVPSLVLLHAVAPEKSELCSQLLQTSLPSNRDAMRDIIPRRNGFVGTVIEAYDNHRGLIVRPDDVWLAIMTQFSFFVNGHAEALRKVFIAREGKRELVVESGGSRYTMDSGSMVHQMTALMEEQIADPSLREWIMPNFTTTTPVDKMTCGVVMMGMMKDYFASKFSLRCGIPKVTLEGEKKDWQTILHRLEHLKKYGIQTIAWYHLLRPILSRFVNAYDHPTNPDNLDFWNKIAHRELGSGPQWLSGWITAFCVFNERGQWQGNTLNEERIREHEPKKLLRPADPLQLTPSHFAAVYTVRERAPYLALDGFPYPTVESQGVPCGYACLDVTLDDHGEMTETMLLAGSVGAQICSTEKTELFRNGLRDTVRPVSAWWYFVKRKVAHDEEDEMDSEG